MKARFEFTIDDLVEVSLRHMVRNGVVRRWRAKGAVVICVVVPVCAFLLQVGSLGTRVSVAVAIASLTALFYVLDVKRALRKRLLNHHRKQFASDGPFACEIELAADGLATRQFDAETKRPWSSVCEINDAEDAIELIVRDGPIILVRNRAFADDEERQAFLNEAREFLHLAQNPK